KRSRCCASWTRSSACSRASTRGCGSRSARCPTRCRSGRWAKARSEPPVTLTDGICELTLEVRDMDVVERFYCDVLGMRVLSRADDRRWLACGERTRLGLWLPGEKEFGDEGGRHVHFALSASPGRLAE